MTSFFRWLDQQERETRAAGSPRDTVYRELKKIWEAAVPEKLPAQPDPDLAWQRLSVNLTPPSRKTSGIHLVRFAWILLPATVLAILFFRVAPFRGNEFVTGRAEVRDVILPDHSTAQLNAESRLSYSRAFNIDHREVHLEGEAFFSVRPAALPFVVRTDFASIKVVGTQFSVFARGGRVTVHVVEGVVTLFPPHGQAARLLNGGMAVTVFRNMPEAPEEKTFEGYHTWFDEGYLVEETPVSLICREIERRFGIEVRLEDPTLGVLEANGLLHGNRPEDLIPSLCALLQREYKYENGVYIIR